MWPPACVKQVVKAFCPLTKLERRKSLVGSFRRSLFKFANGAVDGQFDAAPYRVEPAEGGTELGSVGKRQFVTGLVEFVTAEATDQRRFFNSLSTHRACFFRVRRR